MGVPPQGAQKSQTVPEQNLIPAIQLSLPQGADVEKDISVNIKTKRSGIIFLFLQFLSSTIKRAAGEFRDYKPW